VIAFPGSPGPDKSWNLSLTPRLPLDLRIDLIVGNIEISAQELTFNSLSTSLVIGETSLFLPEKGNFEAKIDGVIGGITIYVPDSMAIRINSEAGIMNVKVPDDFFEQGNSYLSPGYSVSENQVSIEVSQVIGEVQVIDQ
jgi:predicted membrane protein